jgi:hypothetical protein
VKLAALARLQVALIFAFAACNGSDDKDTSSGGTASEGDADTDADADTDVPQGGNGPVWVNEVQPANFTTLLDETGAHPDWVEIWNGSSADVDISGWFLTDDTGWTDKWAFPPGTVVPVNGYTVVFCDGDVLDGPLHTNFRLHALGETAAIYNSLDMGNELVDSTTWAGLTPDTSWARQPDGGEFAVVTTPTPNGPN